jgi:tetratricopeptide (TPR) repeat protein
MITGRFERHGRNQYDPSMPIESEVACEMMNRSTNSRSSPYACRTATTLRGRRAVFPFAAPTAAGLFTLIAAHAAFPAPPPKGPDIPAPEIAAVLDPLMARRFDTLIESARISPSDPKAIGDLGHFYEANGFSHLAAECYGRAARLNPEDPKWMFHEAVIARTLGNNDLAENRLRALLSRRADHAPSIELLGLIQLDRGVLADASQLFQRVAELRPNLPGGHAGLGRTKLAEGNASDAEEHLRRAVELAPNWDGARYYLAAALRLQGRTLEANAEASRVSDHTVWVYLPDPWYSDVTRQAAGRDPLLRIARTLIAAGQAETAVRVLRTLLAVDPRDVPVAQELAELYLRADRPNDVLQILKAPIQTDATNVTTNLHLAAAFHMIGHLSSAQAHAEAAVKQDPNSAEAYYGLGLSLAGQAEFERALDILHRAVELGGGDPRYAQAVCELLIFQKRWNEADGPCRTALSSEPRETAHLFNQGRVCLYLGQIDEAVRLLKAAAERRPQDEEIQEALNKALAEKARE